MRIGSERLSPGALRDDEPLLELAIVTREITLWGKFTDADVYCLRLSASGARRVIGIQIDAGATDPRIMRAEADSPAGLQFCSRHVVPVAKNIYCASGRLVAGDRLIQTVATLGFGRFHKRLIELIVEVGLDDLPVATWVDLCHRWTRHQRASSGADLVMRVSERE